MLLPVPPEFQLDTAVRSSWCATLPPHGYDPAARRLRLVLRLGAAAAPVEVSVEPAPGALRLQDAAGRALRAAAAREAAAQVRAALRLDEDFTLLYQLTDRDPHLCWARGCGAGRLLRAPTAYEDLVKAFVVGRLGLRAALPLLRRLCRALGPAAPSGAAFPTPEEMAAPPPSFYARRLGAGSLGGPLSALARRCADGLYPEAIRRASQPAPVERRLRLAELGELARQESEWEERLEALLLSLPGFGLRAAERLLPLCGCYDVFLYNGHLRAGWERRVGGSREDLRGWLRRFGPYRGLALWLLVRGRAACGA